MSAIITAVFKATIRWLVDKGRDEAAKKFKDGDVTDQQLRSIIIREIDDMKSKLNGLSRKELLTSIILFREGIELLYEVFEWTRSRSEYVTDTAQAACAKAVSFTEGMKDLELTESATRKLNIAKERFKRARERATDAFSNEALSTIDRILAMQYRVMATVLETIDHPEDAVTSCRVCIEDINGLPVVKRSLRKQLKTGSRSVKSLFNKEERRKVISGVCLVNRVAYDVIQTVPVKEPLPRLPMIDTGKEKVDVLRDWRVKLILCNQGWGNCSVLWTLGHDCKEEQGLNYPLDIAINSSGQYIVADDDLTIKVFDNSGKFIQRVRLPPHTDDSGIKLSIDTLPVHLATDMNDNIYVLVRERRRKDSHWIFKFNKTANHHHKFRVGEMGSGFGRCKLSVTDSGTVVVLKRKRRENYWIVDVYETNGKFLCSFGERILRVPNDITTASDSRIMVQEGCDSSLVHIFSEKGEHLNSFDLKGPLMSPKIAFHRESQQVVVASNRESFSGILYIGIYTKDGQFVRSTLIHMEESFLLEGIAVTTEGRIAVVVGSTVSTSKVIII